MRRNWGPTETIHGVEALWAGGSAFWLRYRLRWTSPRSTWIPMAMSDSSGLGCLELGLCYPSTQTTLSASQLFGPEEASMAKRFSWGGFRTLFGGLWAGWAGVFEGPRSYDSGHSLLTRFARQGNHFKGGRPRVGLFEPELFDGRFETSTFTVDGLVEAEIWPLAVPLETTIGRPVVARCDVTTTDVLVTGLAIEVDEAVARHTLIVGWPGTKPERQRLQLTLAESPSARLVRRSASA